MSIKDAMDKHYRAAAIISGKLPRLVSADELSAKTHVSVERIVDLVRSGHMPHWTIDDGAPRFELFESKKWIMDNLVRHKNGQPLPVNICIAAATALVPPGQRPECLRALPDLFDVTDSASSRSGIYFLCLGDAVAYVGQTKNVSARIQQHVGSKQFDRVLFMHWPAHDLDRVEGAMIRLIRPAQNGVNSKSRKGDPCAPATHGSDREVLAALLKKKKVAFVAT